MAVGAVAGAVVVRRVSRAVRSYGPAGLAERTAAAAQRRREFTAAVRDASAEREAALRAAIEQDSPDAPGRLTGRLARRRERLVVATPPAPPLGADADRRPGR